MTLPSWLPAAADHGGWCWSAALGLAPTGSRREDQRVRGTTRVKPCASNQTATWLGLLGRALLRTTRKSAPLPIRSSSDARPVRRRWSIGKSSTCGPSRKDLHGATCPRRAAPTRCPYCTGRVISHGGGSRVHSSRAADRSERVSVRVRAMLKSPSHSRGFRSDCHPSRRPLLDLRQTASRQSNRDVQRSFPRPRSRS